METFSELATNLKKQEPSGYQKKKNSRPGIESFLQLSSEELKFLSRETRSVSLPFAERSFAFA